MTQYQSCSCSCPMGYHTRSCASRQPMPERNRIYRVKELISAFSIPTLQSGFTRRSAAEAWLIDYYTAHKLTIICREVDAENDAIDFMTDALRQFAVEPE